MGICAHKKDQEDQESPDLPSLELPPKPSANHQIRQKLIDLRKARKVPLLSLAHNPLYLKRIAEMTAGDSTGEGSPESNQKQYVLA